MIIIPSLFVSCDVSNPINSPAKSTRLIVLLFLVSWPESFLLIWSKVTVTTVWARELVAFICVAATVRFEVPGGDVRTQRTGYYIDSGWMGEKKTHYIVQCSPYNRVATCDTFRAKKPYRNYTPLLQTNSSHYVSYICRYCNSYI